jgi:hypothetical protein
MEESRSNYTLLHNCQTIMGSIKDIQAANHSHLLVGESGEWQREEAVFVCVTKSHKQYGCENRMFNTNVKSSWKNNCKEMPSKEQLFVIIMTVINLYLRQTTQKINY